MKNLVTTQNKPASEVVICACNLGIDREAFKLFEIYTSCVAKILAINSIFGGEWKKFFGGCKTTLGGGLINILGGAHPPPPRKSVPDLVTYARYTSQNYLLSSET